MGFISYVYIFPFQVFAWEYNRIPWISYWDSYCITMFMPLSLLFPIFSNSAGQAINPLNRRYIKPYKAIIVIVAIAALWYFITNAFMIPFTELFFYSIISVNGTSDLYFLLLYFLSTVGLLIICAVIAAPFKTRTALKSFLSAFKRLFL